MWKRFGNPVLTQNRLIPINQPVIPSHPQEACNPFPRELIDHFNQSIIGNNMPRSNDIAVDLPTVISDSNSLVGSRTKRHFRRRVAQYHSNQKQLNREKMLHKSNLSLPPKPEIQSDSQITPRSIGDVRGNRSLSMDPSPPGQKVIMYQSESGEYYPTENGTSYRTFSQPLMGKMSMENMTLKARSDQQLIRQPATPNSCRSVSTERTSRTVDRWYHKYYTGLSSAETQPVVMMRSPIGVLAACRGKLRLKMGYKNGQISVHVIEARGMRTTNNTSSGTFVELVVVPDKLQHFTQRTPPVQQCSNPIYDHVVVLDLNKSIQPCRRIIVSVYSMQAENGESDFLGGMSFGIPGIQAKQQISGWYYILNESVSRKKHLRAPFDQNDSFQTTETTESQENPEKHSTNPTGDNVTPVRAGENSVDLVASNFVPPPACFANSIPNNGEINVPMCVPQTSPHRDKLPNPVQMIQCLISRGSKGFGFTLSGANPVTVSHVERGSPAQHGGLLIGDWILGLNGTDVSRASVDQIVRLFRTINKPVLLTLGRRPTIDVRLPSVPQLANSKTLSNLFHTSCFSPSKKSKDSFTSVTYPYQIPTPISPQSTHFLLNASQAASQIGNPKYWSPMFPHSVTQMRSSRTTDFRLVDELSCDTPPSVSSQISNRRISLDRDHGSIARSDCGQPYYKPLAKPNNILLSNSHIHQNQLRMYPIKFQPVNHVSNGFTQTPNEFQSIVDHLKYVGHVQRVDFRQHSNQLIFQGCLNLLEADRLTRVDLLMFPDVTLIAQRAPNRYFTVIKEPIFNSKICQMVFPPYAPDQLILGYFDCNNCKQMVHFQDANVRDWYNRFQGRLLYQGNGWMKINQ